MKSNGFFSKFKKYFRPNNNETTYHNLQDIVKAVFRGKYMALKA